MFDLGTLLLKQAYINRNNLFLKIKAVNHYIFTQCHFVTLSCMLHEGIYIYLVHFCVLSILYISGTLLNKEVNFCPTMQHIKNSL